MVVVTGQAMTSFAHLLYAGIWRQLAWSGVVLLAIAYTAFRGNWIATAELAVFLFGAFLFLRLRDP